MEKVPVTVIVDISSGKSSGYTVAFLGILTVSLRHAFFKHVGHGG